MDNEKEVFPIPVREWRIPLFLLFPMIFQEVLNAVECFGNFVDRGGIRTTYMSFAASTECTAGDEGNVFGLQ